MLAIVQFPIIDSRAFCGVRPRPKPIWLALKEDQDFLPQFGGARILKEFEAVPPAWRDDAHYISARWAIRLTGVAEKRDLSKIGIALPRKQQFWVYRPENPATDFCFTPAFRRLWSDGIGLARVDIGFWVFGSTQVRETDALHIVRDVLNLKTDVRGTQQQLHHQAKPLSVLYHLSTRSASDVTQHPGTVVAGAPVVVLDDGIGKWALPRKPQWYADAARQLGMPLLDNFPSGASIVSEETAGSLRLAYTTLELHAPKKRVGVWIIGRARAVSRDAAQASQGLRHCLLRLHAIRQGVFELCRLGGAGFIPYSKTYDGSDPFESYLNELAGQVLKATAYGANQAELQEILSLYDLGEGGGERRELESAVAQMPINRQIRARVIEATRLRDDRSISFYVETINMTDSGPITTISQTGSGTMTIGTISQAGRDLIEESKKHVGKIKDTKLKDAMGQLTKLVETLAAKAPDAATQEEAAKKLKQLTEEASSSKPDGKMLKVTGEGLVDAAKTVAEMVGPITTAVKGVLSILGVVL